MKIEEVFNTMAYGPAPESQDEANKWLDSFNRRFSLYIGGQWHDPKSGVYLKTINPATQDTLAEIAVANEQDIAFAVESAAQGFDTWQTLGDHGRARYLYALARQIQKHSRLLSVLETLDNGKPIRESRDIDIPLVARHFYHHAGWAQILSSKLAAYQAVGVVGQIIPWNFPLLMLAWKIAPALAAGNTVVLKPSRLTSLTALCFADICQQANLPAGVVNIVTGNSKTGEHILNHPQIKKIAFTGSTGVGRFIRQVTAGSGKKLSLELGGKSPFIVFEDADQDSAVEGVVDAIWFNQGQVCCAGSRLLIQESIAPQFIGKLKTRMKSLRIGDPMDKSTDIGAIISPEQYQSVKAFIAQGEQEGNICTSSPLPASQNKGHFLPASLITNVNPASTLAQEEIFGPVLVAMTFRTPAEAVEIANNTRYGLAASIWTENINTALHLAPQIKAGAVWINCHNVFDAAAGFGGYKESGYGREGGIEGLHEYLKIKPGAQRQVSHATPSVTKETSKQSKKLISKGVNPTIDQTAKLYINGKQVRPDGGYYTAILQKDGTKIGEVPTGNRKDIRNAVEAAQKATGWSQKTAHHRAQVLYYLAENLALRKEEMATCIALSTENSISQGLHEVETAIERIYDYAALADKYDGNVHHTPYRNVTIAMPEAIGVIGIVCPQINPLIGLISCVIPAVAMGNTTVVIPSSSHPIPSTRLYQIFDTSDIPGGVINMVTGDSEELGEVMALHDDIESVWYFGNQSGIKIIEHASAGNMKRSWASTPESVEWWNPSADERDRFLRQATQTKNIWVPYGV